MSTPFARRFIAYVLITTAVVLPLTSCNRAEAPAAIAAIGQQIGLVETPALPAVLVSILCDPSDGASCTPGSLRDTVQIALSAVSGRPGSIVRGWVLGEELATTTLLAEQTVPSRAEGQSERALRAARARFVATAQTYFEKAFEPVFSSTPIRRTILAEGLTRISLTGAPAGMEHIVIVISDGWEYSRFADMECRSLPETASFVRTLQNDRVLAAKSFDGAIVAFTFVELRAIRRPGCAVTPARAFAARDLWTAALRAAGARDVVFSTGRVDPVVFRTSTEVTR